MIRLVNFTAMTWSGYKGLIGLVIFFCCFIFPFSRLYAQVVVTGKVIDSAAHRPLFPATVLDQHSGEVTYTDSAGAYRMVVLPGDTLSFSFVGFRTAHYRIPGDRIARVLDVRLASRLQDLKGVEVHAHENFLPDSLWKIYTSPAPEKQRNRLLGGSSFGAGGFGLSFHPFTYFSKAEHLKRRLHKLQAAQDREKFSNAQYTPEIVHRLTGLSGDSLQLFLRKYQPTYGFSRYATRLEFWSWIMIQYQSWLNGSSEK